MTSETKQCTDCGEEKPATSEYFHKRNNGIRTICKVCVAKRDKARYEANRQAIAEQKKTYYKANREARIEYSKAYAKAHREAKSEYQKAHYRTTKGKFNQIKKQAKKRGINFSLSFGLYESQLWGKPCHYCGCKIEVTGLDRKDNDKGYEVGNVVPCCHKCNSKKRAKPYEEFVAEIKN